MIYIFMGADTDGYSFTVTSANMGGGRYGYQNPNYGSGYGTIDNHPIPSHEIVSVWTEMGFHGIMIAGNALYLVGDKNIYINGALADVFAPWDYDSSEGVTHRTFYPMNDQFPAFGDGVTFFIELRP